MKAHKYNLKVEFEAGNKWDLLILAVSITWVFLWITNEHKVKTLSIDLIESNVCEVKEGFGARSLNELPTINQLN